MRRSLVAVASSLLFTLVPVAGSRATTDAGATAAEDKAEVEVEIAEYQDASSTATPLSDRALETRFGRGPCLCGETVEIAATLTETGRAQISTRSLGVDLYLGSDCTKPEGRETRCRRLGTGTLEAGTPRLAQSVSVADLFAGTAGGASCKAEGTESRTVWAVLTEEGKTVETSPSRTFKIHGTSPGAPTLLEVLPGDRALEVKWKATDKAGTVRYQVLCDPAPSEVPEAAFEACAASDGAGVVDAAKVCSKPVTGTSARVQGLTNGLSYRLRVVGIDDSGTPGAASSPKEGSPLETKDFLELYEDAGGSAQPGCSAGPGGASRSSLLFGAGGLLALVLLRRRRSSPRGRGGRAGLLLLLEGAAIPARAHAETALFLDGQPTITRSPVGWVFEARLGAYRPDIDGELGDGPGPFERVFSGERRPMLQAELDYQIYRGIGSAALGFGIGHWQASGHNPFADGKVTSLGRSGDQSRLGLVPLSVGLVYRFDLLTVRSGFPFVPFVKAGLDYARWSASSDGGESRSGWTPGYHFAAGVALQLDALDRETAAGLDGVSGINHTYLFVEGALYELSGLGLGRRLHLGDRTWFAGLALEF